MEKTINLHFIDEDKGGYFNVTIDSIDFERTVPGQNGRQAHTVLMLKDIPSQYRVKESIKQIKQLIQQAQSD